MKITGTRRALAGAIGLLALCPALALAQVPLEVDATATSDGAPPHNVLCSAESTQVLDCRVWSPTGAVVERARPTTDGVTLLDISQVSGADTTMALAVVVGGAGNAELTQQRTRNSLAVALQGIGARALVGTAFAGDAEVDFGPNSTAMQRALIDHGPVTDAEALAPTVLAAIDALAEVEDRPRALVVAGNTTDAFSGRDISRLTRRLQAEDIVLTLVLLPSDAGGGEAAIADLPAANVVDTRSLDGALSGQQAGALPAFAVPTIRMRLGTPAGLTGDGVGVAAEFGDGSRTEFRVAQGAGGVTSIGSAGGAFAGALALLPRNVGMIGGTQGYIAWIVVIVLGGLIALYGILRPNARKEAIDVGSLRQMRMKIEDAEVAGSGAAAGAVPVTEATEARDPSEATAAHTAVPEETALHGGGGRALGVLTFAGSGRVETLRDGVTRIGRLGPPDNDIVINESHVSRRHAEIFPGEDGRLRIRNLSITQDSQSRRENPVFVNGTQITGDTVLSDGDEIRMAGTGDTRFTVGLETR